MFLKYVRIFFSTVSNECAVYSVTTHSVKTKKWKHKPVVSVLYLCLFQTKHSLWKHVSSPTLSLYWCIGCLLTTSKEGDETWAHEHLLDMRSMISTPSYSPDLPKRCCTKDILWGHTSTVQEAVFVQQQKGFVSSFLGIPILLTLLKLLSTVTFPFSYVRLHWHRRTFLG